MDNTTTVNKKSFLQNDRRLVCGMLVFYGVCIIGIMAVAFWWLARRNQTISADATSTSARATSTAAVIATQQAALTSTAIVRSAEQDKYEYIERFAKITGDWFVGSYGKKYGDMRMIIKNGVYVWDVADSKGFTQSTEFYKEKKIKDFDIYVDSKFVKDAVVGAACNGFFFRKPSTDWNHGAYTFAICDDSRFEIYYYGENRWQSITFVEFEDSIRPSDWNRIEISARGNHFIFTINNVDVFEVTDDRLKEGSLGLFIDIDEGNAAEIWFDNFGYQSR